MVKPILLYMADLWGCKIPKKDPIESVQIRYLKQVLGVQIQTTNIGILLETGEIPISIHAMKCTIKNWVRIARKNGNKLITCSLESAENENLSWYEQIRNEFFTNGLGDIFVSAKFSTDIIEHIYYQRKIDIFYQTAFSKIKENNNKLRTYSLFKSEKGYEKYLTEILSIQERTTFTKFRLSNHNLNIEKMRHIKPKPEIYERVCPFCPNEVEDELHFLLSCKTLKVNREALLSYANNIQVGFKRLTNDQKMIVLTSDHRFIKHTAAYIHKNFELRDFLLKQHKNNT